MLLLKITGMALLVAPAMAAYCDDLIGTTPEYFTRVRANKDGLPGCGASRCKDINKWVGRTFSKTSVCEDNGMRLCTIQELEAGHAKGTGCDFDDQEIWSSSKCDEGGVVGRSTYHWGHKKRFCREEHKGKSIKCCADDRPEPTPEPTVARTGTCDLASPLSDGCKNLMTQPNGSCRTGTINTCVLCSGCDYYGVNVENEQDSATYMIENPHCARCRKLGKRTTIRKKADFSGSYNQFKPWSCLASHSMPADCMEFAACDRLDDDNEEKRFCDKYYNTL